MKIKEELLVQAKKLTKAADLIGLGARLQVLEDLTPMPREKLLKLYREIKKESPPRGMLPFSTDWFLEWQPSIHSAIFWAIRNSMVQKMPELKPDDLLLQSYRIYRDKITSFGLPEVLTLTRAWSLERFANAKLLKETPCKKCGGIFFTHEHDIGHNYVCGLCHMPPRAGKTRVQVVQEQQITTEEVLELLQQGNLTDTLIQKQDFLTSNGNNR